MNISETKEVHLNNEAADNLQSVGCNTHDMLGEDEQAKLQEIVQENN